MSINKKLSFLILIFSFVLIANLVRGIARLKSAQQRVIKVEERLVKVKKENEELEQKRNHYQSDQFVEEQIRNKLQMAKPGETVLILPEEIQIAAREAEKETPEDKDGEKANWQKWIELFK